MDKREARKQFKSKVTPKGVFAVRCTVSGEAWVAASDHLDSARNGLWFQLRNRLHPNRQLQAAWNACGEDAFEYSILETLDEDMKPLTLKDTLQERQKHWMAELNAPALWPA